MESNQTMEIEATPYSYESSQSEDIQIIAQRVRELRQGGKLTPDVLGNIRRYFRIKNTYHSNAIEGNVLTVGETRQVVEHGLTITGKPLKDQAEAKNLSEALDFLETLAGDPSVPILETDIRQLHYLVLKKIDDENAGMYRTIQVEISGSKYRPPAPESVAGQMQELGVWLAQASVAANKLGATEGLLVAAAAHTWLVYIHPFVDGNGRVARLLMNVILMRFGYPIAVITKEDRLRYYDALEISQTSDLSPFLALICESVHESLEEYEEAAKEQREKEEWAASLAARFAEPEKIRAQNQYEVWKNAMELLKSYFRQMVALLDEGASVGHVYFKDFGNLEFEKYLSLRGGDSAKKTWFFRVDFRSGDRAVRYLFFFGSPSYSLRAETDVTLHVAREEPAGSFRYERLDSIPLPNVPAMVEIGYKPKEEKFVAKTRNGARRTDKIEKIGGSFFEDVVSKHFQT